MAGTTIERIQAPYGGINADASPDYVGGTQAPILENLLPGFPGKVVCRGPITDSAAGLTSSFTTASAVWTIDDTALLRCANSTTQQVDLAAMTGTDVTAAIGKVPASSAHTRYGSKVYGAIVDGTTSPALGAWSGGTIALQTNAPYGFTDVQVYAKRLWTLGGTVPGTTSPVKKYSLFYSDPNPAADLTLTASWVDDVSALTNELIYDADDTPIAFASCGRFMAILGTNSINILTGSGSSSFAVRNLTKNWGATNLESVVEVSDGFYFNSTRGYCYCDGAAVTVVSDNAVSSTLRTATGPIVSASFDGGYIAVSSGALDGSFLLLHAETHTWTKIIAGFSDGGRPVYVARTSTYPFYYAGKSVRRCEKVTVPDKYTLVDQGQLAINAHLRSREVRLGAPTQRAKVASIVVDYRAVYTGNTHIPGHGAWLVQVLREGPTTVLPAYATAVSVNAATGRQRAIIDVMAEADTLQLDISWDYTTSAPDMTVLEVYDCWVDYQPAMDTAGF